MEQEDRAESSGTESDEAQVRPAERRPTETGERERE